MRRQRLIVIDRIASNVILEVICLCVTIPNLKHNNGAKSALDECMVPPIELKSLDQQVHYNHGGLFDWCHLHGLLFFTLNKFSPIGNVNIPKMQFFQKR